MARRPPAAEQILDDSEGSVLDLLDRLLNTGVMVNGDITLGVAGVDLIYLRLSTLFCAADRILPRRPGSRRRHASRPLGRRLRR